MSDFSNVWVWGNPLSEENRTYAPYLENHTSYLLLATITRQMFYRTYQIWLKELFRAQVTIDNLLEIAQLIHEAYKARRDITPFIAHRLNCDEKRVGRMLLFLDIQAVLEMVIPEPVKQKGHIPNKKQSHYPAPTDKQLSKMMTYVSHPCAAGFEGCCGDMKGRFAICSRCYKKLGSYYEADWDELTLKWLPAEIRRIRKVWKKEARNMWYQQQYTEITIEELERLDIAA